jgi:hypothetical protein
MRSRRAALETGMRLEGGRSHRYIVLDQAEQRKGDRGKRLVPVNLRVRKAEVRREVGICRKAEVRREVGICRSILHFGGHHTVLNRRGMGVMHRARESDGPGEGGWGVPRRP